MEDEFVIFPNNSTCSSTHIDIGHLGSHDPTCSNESSRHHRPTGPEHTLRCDEDEVNSLGSAREMYPGEGSSPSVSGGPPSGIGDAPGKLVAQFTGSSVGLETQCTTPPGNSSTLVVGEGEVAEFSKFWKSVAPKLKASNNNKKSESLADRPPVDIIYTCTLCQAFGRPTIFERGVSGS